MVKSVDGWVRHWDAKSAIEDPVELNGYCVGGKPLAFETYRKAVIVPTVDRLEVEPGQSVLEIGCGSGLILNELERRGADCVGVDPSKAMLDKYSGNAKTILSAARECDFADGSFDRILMVSVAHYFPSLTYFSDVIARCVKWLRAPGILLIGDIPFVLSANSRNDYLVYDKHALLDVMDSFGHATSLVAQSQSKRAINRRLDVILYKDRA